MPPASVRLRYNLPLEICLSIIVLTRLCVLITLLYLKPMKVRSSQVSGR
jgi:phage gp36-like protein